MPRTHPASTSMMTGRRRRRVRSPLILLATVLVSTSAVVLVHSPAAVAATPAPVMTGFVPLESNATQKSMENVNALAEATLDFTVGITNAGAGAVMYYDHWEDGFEPDLTNVPVGSTTQVWGDGVVANGNAFTYCTTCAGDLLPAGAVFVLRNLIDTPRVAADIRWDGRDRVASTRGFAISAGGFSTLGSVLAASASAYDTSKWGTEYWIPVGENMAAVAGTGNPFSTTSLQIMAAEDGTDVSVDRTGDGIDDVFATINRGEVAHIDGGVRAGARVRSTKPVQVHQSAGDAGSVYELRWFTLFPTPLLTFDYLNPVGSSVDNQRTITYLFNPGTSTISVTAACTGCPGAGSPFSIIAKGGVSFASPLSQAVRFTSAGNAPFVAVGAIGSQSGAAPGSTGDGSSTYDWGFGLVPTNLLTTKAVLGWAPGNSTNPPSGTATDRDDDPVWISALANTNLHIDYDGNPATGTLVSTCDGNYDELRAVTANTSNRIIAVDGDMTGARIFTCDGVKLAGAWGEDPAAAPAGAPGFDAGYALIPSTAMIVDKTAGTAVDANGDGRIGPGDTLEYVVSIADAGALAFTSITVGDALPAATTYVPNSTTYTVGAGAPSPFADDVTPAAATAYPFDEDGASIAQIDPGTTVHLRYRVQINTPFPAGTTILNTVAVVASEAGAGDTIVTQLKAADLSLTKAVTSAPTYLGESATFRLTLTNGGPDAAGGVAVLDALPAGLTFVSSTASQGSYVSGTGVWTVGTVASSASATLDITAVVTAMSVTNTAQVSTSDAADPDSTPANSSGTEDDQASVTVNVLPRADVSLTKVRASGPDVAGDTTFTLIAANAGLSPATGVVVADYPPAGSSFVSATPQTSAVADGTFDGGTGTWTVPTLAVGAQAVFTVVYNTPVAPSANYAQVTAANENDPDSAPDAAPLTAANPPDQDDEAVAGIPASGDLSVTNVVTSAPTYVGDLVTFTVTVTNDGPTNTTGVMVVDQLPPGLAFMSATPSLGTYDAGTGLWNIGPMAAGDVRSLVLVARVMAAGTLSTTAELTASTAADIDSAPSNGVVSEDDQQTNAVVTTGASLGDTVWYDVDLDGVFEAGEPGLVGVSITATWAGPNATAGDGDDIAYSTAADSAGTWSLTGLPYGNYVVAVNPATLPFGMTVATFDVDGIGTPHVASVSLAGGESRTDVDFAYTGSALTGDRVFEDLDADGSFDAGEGIDGVDVDLVWFGPDNAVGGGDDVTYATTTDASGLYQFANLPAGNYAITVDTGSLPAGLTNSVDPDGGGNSTAAFDLATGETDTTLDFGFVGTNSVGDTVFVDTDGDGTQDPGEPGLGGVALTLLRDTDNNGSFETVTRTTVTAGAGTYQFDALPAGSYRVDVTTPSGQTATTPNTVAVTLTDGQTVLTADFGFAPPTASTGGSIGDLVWDDADVDGVQDIGEAGVDGVTVTLRADLNGTGVYDIIATQVTASDGSYSFANLPAGRYRLVVSVPAGSFATTPDSTSVNLGAGAFVDTADFGLASEPPAPGTIGDRVWDDLDGDGTQDVGEPGLAGVTVTIRSDLDGDGVFETIAAAVVTDVNGDYSVTAAPGNYRVVVAPAAQTLTTPISVLVTVTPDSTVDTADFGLTTGAVAPGSISNRVWLDVNRDGVQDAGEPGVNGATVTLRQDADGDGSFETNVASSVSSGDGNYLFSNLAPGTYLVAVTPPDGLAVTVPAIEVQLVAGQVVVDADIGLATAFALPFDLALDKTLSGTAVAGGTATWEITVSNNSVTPTPATLTVVDSLPAGLSFVSAVGTGWICTAAGQDVTCMGGGPLDLGERAQFQIVTTILATAGADLRNVAVVSASGPELSSANNTDDASALVSPSPTTTTTTTTTTTPPSTPGTTPPPQSPAALLTARATPLPSTGANSMNQLRAAFLLFAAGVLVVVVGRRKSPSPETK